MDTISKDDLLVGFGLKSPDSIGQKGASDFGSEVFEYACTASQLNRLSEKALRGASGDCIVSFFESNAQLDFRSSPLLVALSGTKRQRMLATTLVELSLAETGGDSDRQGSSFVTEGTMDAAFRKNTALGDHALALEVPAVVVESLLTSRPDVLDRGDAMFFFEKRGMEAVDDEEDADEALKADEDAAWRQSRFSSAVEDNEEAAKREDNRTGAGDENPKSEEAEQENEIDSSTDSASEPNSVPAPVPQDQLDQQDNCQQSGDRADVVLPQEMSQAEQHAELMAAVNVAMMFGPSAAPPVVRTASALNPSAAEFVPGSHQTTAKVWIVSATEAARYHGSFLLQAYIEEKNAGTGFANIFHRKFLETTKAQLAEWENDDLESGTPKTRTDFFKEEADKIKFWLKGRVVYGDGRIEFHREEVPPGGTSSRWTSIPVGTSRWFMLTVELSLGYVAFLSKKDIGRPVDVVCRRDLDIISTAALVCRVV